MIGLICWTRSFTFDKDGAMIKDANGNPVFAAHPQPLWNLLESDAQSLAGSFDMIQLPPAAKGPGEGYAFTELRNFASNWGSQQELIAAIEACHAAGMRVSIDFSCRQMGGENGGPGVFNYMGRLGETTPSWFQYFGQTGETMPPFVAQDDIPDTQGNFPFGRVRSYQHCIPTGVVEADTTDALKTTIDLLKIDMARFDDAKAQHVQSVARIMNTVDLEFYAEFFAGDPHELNWWATTAPMNSRSSVEDFTQYWHTQAACNNYDATQFERGGGYWQWRSDLAIGFVDNPDVGTSWGPKNGISQQIAFNLLLGYALNMCLPYKLFLIYAEDFYPASPEYPTGRGFKHFLENLCWFSRTFAFGGYQQRWVDSDVFAYTRDGNGGATGWSGGCLVAANFNTLNARTITVQTTWEEGRQVHNYSATGHNEDYTVGHGGRLTITIKSNAFSNGQSYVLIAPSGVNHSVKMHPIT